MAVVLRLQGLNTEADAEDIRRFFHGLPILKGGVHITGGKTGEAFIIFSTERAGQLAMLCSGQQLKGSTVTLHKSSMRELMHNMEAMLQKRKCAPGSSEPVPQVPTTTEPWASLLLSVVAAVQELVPFSTPQFMNIPKSGKDAPEESLEANQTPPSNNQVQVTEPARCHVKDQQRGVREVTSCKPGYLRLYGLPDTITKEEVCQFLEGLKVEEVITDTLQGQERCCLVKMASFKEAEEGLKYSYSSPSCPVEVRLAHERMWEKAMEHREISPCSTPSEQDRFSPDRRLLRNSPVKRPCSFGGSPKRRRTNSPSFATEYCVMVKNLPNTITKTEIKGLFSCPDIPNSKILHLLNKWKKRTSTVFILFTQPEQYTVAMNMNGSMVDSRKIDVSSITNEKMKDLMYQNRYTESERSESCSRQTQPVLSCMYARNFPADVRKADVKDFFSAYNISEEDVELLEDENGNKIGEAVIRFGCEEHSRAAHTLHRERFRQEQILLTCISPQQMKDILHKTG